MEAIAAFLHREARLLDERRWDDWLDLWSPDSSYGMPTRQAGGSVASELGSGPELTADGGVWWFDESRDVLAIRIAKLKTGKAWAEEPPSRTRRFVSNLERSEGSDADSVRVRSNLLIHRSRRDHEVQWYSCGRCDEIARRDGRLVLTSRRVTIDANVVTADHLMLFF